VTLVRRVTLVRKVFRVIPVHKAFLVRKDPRATRVPRDPRALPALKGHQARAALSLWLALPRHQQPMRRETQSSRSLLPAPAAKCFLAAAGS
jgi:hypothetical protein